MTVELYGYRYSVYSWIARLALEEKGGDYHWIEVNPFAPDVPESYLGASPLQTRADTRSRQLSDLRDRRDHALRRRGIPWSLSPAHGPAPSRPLQPVPLHH